MTELITKRVIHTSIEWLKEQFENKSHTKGKYIASLKVQDEPQNLFVSAMKSELFNALTSPTNDILVTYDKNSKKVFKLLINNTEFNV